LQRLTATDSLYFNYTRQWANRQLDSSQQMSVAGSNSVRAFDTGVSPSGNSASMLSAEYRRELGTILSGQLTGLVFYDKGDVTINKHGSGENNRFTLNGPGLGLTWAGLDSWSAKAFAATPTGNIATVSGAATATATRLWMEIGRGF
jgi:hemolysin activation/secretion protein